MLGLNTKPVYQFFNLLKLDKKEIYQIYVFSLFSGILSLTLPLGIQAIVNFLQFGKISASWVVLLVFVVLGIAFSGMLFIFQTNLTEQIQRKIFARASFDFTYRIPRIKHAALSEHYAPELMNRFFDVLTLQKGLPKILLDLTTAVLQIVLGLILLCFYHPFFIFFSILMILLLGIVGLLSFNPGLSSSIKESKYKYKVVYWLEEIARSVETFRLAGETLLPEEKTDMLVSRYLNYRDKNFHILRYVNYSLIGFKIIIALGLLLIGSLLVLNQQMNIGQFVAAEIIILLIISSIEKLMSSIEVVFDVLTATDKISHITELPLETDHGSDFKKIDTGHGLLLGINNLVFRAKRKKLLDIPELMIHPAEKICLSGYERSGRSTLLKLIAGLYEEYEGNINYNRIPLASINVKSLRSYIGDSLGQEDLFEGTIYENITLGRPNLDISHIKWAAEKTKLTSIIEEMKYGYDTHFEPGDEAISKSIARKIILTRSIVDKPRMLLLDAQNISHFELEIITSLVKQTEVLWTMVLVSNDHRLAEVCDRVIIMDKGSIVANDTYSNIIQEKKHTHVFD